MNFPPSWIMLGNGFKRKAQRLQLQQIQFSHSSNDCQAVRALHRASLQEAALLQPAQERIKNPPFGVMGDEPLAKFAEDACIKAGISQRQMQCVLPVDAGTDPFRSDAV